MRVIPTLSQVCILKPTNMFVGETRVRAILGAAYLIFVLCACRHSNLAGAASPEPADSFDAAFTRARQFPLNVRDQDSRNVKLRLWRECIETSPGHPRIREAQTQLFRLLNLATRNDVERREASNLAVVIVDDVDWNSIRDLDLVREYAEFHSHLPARLKTTERMDAVFAHLKRLKGIAEERDEVRLTLESHRLMGLVLKSKGKRIEAVEEMFSGVRRFNQWSRQGQRAALRKRSFRHVVEVDVAANNLVCRLEAAVWHTGPDGRSAIDFDAVNRLEQLATELGPFDFGGERLRSKVEELKKGQLQPVR